MYGRRLVTVKVYLNTTEHADQKLTLQPNSIGWGATLYPRERNVIRIGNGLDRFDDVCFAWISLCAPRSRITRANATLSRPLSVRGTEQHDHTHMVMTIHTPTHTHTTHTTHTAPYYGSNTSLVHGDYRRVHYRAHTHALHTCTVHEQGQAHVHGHVKGH